MKTIISLTSIPSRFPSLGPTLSSLVAQGADEVRLYIPAAYRRFPAWDGCLPDVPDGVQIVRCAEDLGPATKVLPAVRDFQGQDVQILFCDDDCRVPPGWARRLFACQASRPDEVVAVYVRGAYVPRQQLPATPLAWQVPVEWDVPYRFSRLMHKVLGTPVAHRRPFWRAGYGDVFFGVGGVVVRPTFFDAVAFDIPDVAWLVDDIWLSAMVARQGVRIYCPWRAAFPQSQDSAGVDALLDVVAAGQDRQDLNRAASEYCRDSFGVWP